MSTILIILVSLVALAFQHETDREYLSLNDFLKLFRHKAIPQQQIDHLGIAELPTVTDCPGQSRKMDKISLLSQSPARKSKN